MRKNTTQSQSLRSMGTEASDAAHHAHSAIAMPQIHIRIQPPPLLSLCLSIGQPSENPFLRNADNIPLHSADFPKTDDVWALDNDAIHSFRTERRLLV